MKRLWRTETTVFVGIWLVLLLVGRSQFFADPGALWHIVVGERMLSSGELIRTDPFSCTFGGARWIPQSWLPECGLAVLHRLGGLDAVLLATVTLIAGLYTWVTHRLLRAGLHPLLAVLVTVLAMAASSYQFHPRPLLITLALLGWTFARLCDFEAGRIPLRGLFWLVPVFVLWTNCHAGVLAGMGTVAVAVAGWIAAKLVGWETPLVRYHQLIPLVGLVVACCLTALVNPYGLQLPRVWFSLVGSPVLPRLMQEHAPLLASWPEAGIVLAFGLVYAAALVGVLPKQLRVAWLVPLVWFGLTVTSIRHGPLFAVTAALALGDMFPHIRWVAWLARRGNTTFRLRPPEEASPKGWDFGPALVPLALVLTAAVLQLTAVPFPVLGRGWARPDPRSSPVELLPELRADAAGRPGGMPIFNDMLFGGFLIYFTPDLRVFIDDRCELYGDRWLEQFADAQEHHPERIELWADEYGFDRALVLPGSGFDRYLSDADGWALVRRTPEAVLYRRGAKSPSGQ
ncbi:MAG TPA: hypothetical protein DDY78_21430 [Planctomycetales bacterium]|nr:hypothetical protein [Planctomycetales bacterium]